MLPEGPHHLHLDPLGGVAGDMMVAALWALVPGFRAAHSLAALGAPPSLEVALEPAHDAGFAGSRLAIRGDAPPPPQAATELLAFAAEAPLPEAVRARIVNMLERLALAEAEVHGITLAEVHFHELASWDTLIDLTLSAALLATLRVETVSIGPLPLGGGTIDSAHGALPLPAPATLRLLRGLRFVDDGIHGERVTPTGAAILAHLQPTATLPGTPVLVGSGAGFGTQRLPDRAKQLRALLFRAAATMGAGNEIARIRFEIEDQSGEDLAIALDAIRAVDEVVDVVACPVFGKKGRIATAGQVLVQPAGLGAAIEACLSQTTIIGLRHDRVAWAVLPRRTTLAEGLPVKEVRRPNGRASRKVEADAVARRAGDAVERAALRHRLETSRPA